MKLEGFFRCHLEKLCESLADLIERRAAKATAKKLESRTAQSGRWQRDRPSCTFANLNKSNSRTCLSQALLRNGLQHKLCGLTPQVVEDDIDSLPEGVEMEMVGAWSDPTTSAARLYEAIRALDAANLDVLFARDLADVSIGLGRALADRLRRAARRLVDTRP